MKARVTSQTCQINFDQAMQAIIVSLKNQRTVVVKVERVFSHRLFGKTVKKDKNYQVELPQNLSGENLRLGQKVEISPTAPRSAQKHFLLVKAYD